MSQSRQSTRKPPRNSLQNRLHALMAHTTRYAFKGETRLAEDAGVSKSAVSRLANGLSSPSFIVISAITRALEKQLKRRLDPRDIVSFDGSYPTPSPCAVCGCSGCLPDEAYDENDTLKAEFRTVQPGHWPASKPMTRSRSSHQGQR